MLLSSMRQTSCSTQLIFQERGGSNKLMFIILWSLLLDLLCIQLWARILHILIHTLISQSTIDKILSSETKCLDILFKQPSILHLNLNYWRTSSSNLVEKINSWQLNQLSMAPIQLSLFQIVKL